MIEKITYLSHDKLAKYIIAKHIVFSKYNAIIYIGDKHLLESFIRVNFAPILFLDFKFVDFWRELGPIPQNAKDKISHEARFKKIRERHKKLPTDIDAEKIINFCNELFRDKNPIWKLWVCCPDGRRSSASIIKFLHAVNVGNPTIEGLDCVGLEWHNEYLTHLLAFNYGRMINESYADSKSSFSR